MSIDESTGTHISMMEKVALKDHSLNDWRILKVHNDSIRFVQ
jgi:hypothetical protein